MAKEQSKKNKKSEKRRLESLNEMDKLELGVLITTSRQRKATHHRDSQYILASLKQMADAVKRGGLVVGSM